MMEKTPWLKESEIILADGSTVLWSYDTEGDVLEVIFHKSPASGTVELADGIFLRFDRERERPLSLGIVSVTPLTKQQEFGPPLLALTGLSKLPEKERAFILKLLQSPPVNAILKVYSFAPKTRARAIPVASFSQTLPLAS